MNAQEPRLRDVLRVHRRLATLAVVLLLLTLLAGTALLAVSGHFLTAAALAGTGALGFNFFGPSAGIRALTFVRILSRYAEKLVGHDATLRIARDLRVWFFRRALPLAPLGLGRHRVGELVTRLLADIEAVDGRLVRAVGPLLAVLALCALAVGLATCVLPTAGGVLLVTLLLLGVAAPWWSIRRAAALEDARAGARTRLRAGVQEGIEGQVDLAAMEATSAWLQGLDARSRDVAHWDGLRRRRLADATLLQAVVGACALPAMLWLLLSAVDAGRLDAALAGGLFFMTVAVLDACSAIAPAWQAWHAAAIAARRLEDVVEVSDPHRGAGNSEPAAQGVLALNAVTFAWPGTSRRVLDHAMLRVEPGEHVVIAGDSGAGKSSLVALVLGLCEPQTGEVSFAGADLRMLAPVDWHARIAWLPQDAPVFSGSVRENLQLGDPDADDARLWSVLAQVRLEAHVRGLTDGLDAWVGENGATLSAGQARRLALARALLRDAPLLLLDEPTEGLDQDTADALMLDFADAARGRSALIISHAALPDGVADARYRLRDGRLVRE
ncbi:thiol reductant ABC exporter subunit CydC [Pseudoxanthomonas sp. Root630]|uniref:thiol reductant ABC exporter subunit CydC n=1 Tax=Pseudoxanthomonas sp. Root630 TaxID=1736574 RepID=UPI0007025BFD|nr:thiol reductant ABC exporter subunit CydC [Pseudoxanthomonas sp. Root630]KRA42820.1 ABC transporter ATP-binding protein [Pseudoxanthomonas sp. Root630]